MTSKHPNRRAQLLQLLERFEPNDPVERGHLDRMKRLLASDRDPFHRDHYEPGHFTASAFVLSRDERRVLLILHGKLGLWLQPGGHVDPEDDDVVVAARREVREETGIVEADLLAPIFDVDVHGIPARGRTPAHEHFDVRCLLRARAEEATAASDARAVRWVDLEAVRDIHSDDSVLRAIEKLRAGRGAFGHVGPAFGRRR